MLDSSASFLLKMLYSTTNQLEELGFYIGRYCTRSIGKEWYWVHCHPHVRFGRLPKISRKLFISKHLSLKFDMKFLNILLNLKFDQIDTFSKSPISTFPLVITIFTFHYFLMSRLCSE